ncbi:MAG: outer membrane beta-barrel protein [Alphaproteobacteria bacterium]
MKKILLAGAALAALATTAQAADLGSARTPIAASVASPTFNWTGFYLGGHLGANFLSSGYRLTGGVAPYDGLIGQSFSRSPSGFLGGIQLGYNWMATPNFLLGVEASGSLSSLSSRFGTPAGLTTIGGIDTFRVSNPFLANISARAGVTADRALFFGKVGLAIGTINYSQTDPAAVRVSSNTTRAGLLLGAGIEYAIAQNWTIGAEYNYNWFGNYTTNAGPGSAIYRTRSDVHVVKATLNYLFSTGPAPVSARY